MKYQYWFNDGTVLTLIYYGLSYDEIWKLEELHGRCVKITESEE